MESAARICCTAVETHMAHELSWKLAALKTVLTCAECVAPGGVG